MQTNTLQVVPDEEKMAKGGLVHKYRVALCLWGEQLVYLRFPSELKPVQSL